MGYDPMIEYAEDTSTWEPWQTDYRFGVILILPPADVGQIFDDLRRTHDPESFETCRAHVSVSDPLVCEMTPDIVSEIEGSLEGVSRFELGFGTLTASRDHAGVSCPISPQDRIDHLKAALHTTSGFGSKPYRRRSIPAHMTIAEFISIEDGLRLACKLQGVGPGTFAYDRLTLMVPNDGFRFHPCRTFEFTD
jgi:hypothetical protein